MLTIDDFSHLCRLCLVMDRVNRPIFDGNEEISAKINSFLPVVVSPEDNLPKQICDDCTYKLDLIGTFRTTSANSESRLLECLSRVDLSQVPVSIKQETVDASEGSVTEEPPSKRPKPADYETDGSDGDAGDVTGIPKEEDIDSEELDRGDYVESSTDNPPNASGEDKGAVEAPCSLRLDIKEDPEEIFFVIETQPHYEPEPTETSDHQATWPFNCEICHKNFSKKSNLNRHRVVHGEKPHKCEICSKSFIRRSELTRHLRVHTERFYQCEICGAMLPTSNRLKSHKKIHKEHVTHKCDICNKEFVKKFNLDYHVRIHMGEKPYQCEVCGKRFANFGNMVEHGRVHTGEKPYLCKFCGKMFSHQGSLKRHLRIHTGEKPYKCKVCDKRFSDYGNLRSHMEVHTDERPYKCAICHKGFKRMWKLRRHEVIHSRQT